MHRKGKKKEKRGFNAKPRKRKNEQDNKPLRWFNTSGLNRFGLPCEGISKWFGVSCCVIPQPPPPPIPPPKLIEPGPRRVVVADEGVQRSLKFCLESDIVIVEWAGPPMPPLPPPPPVPAPLPRPFPSGRAPPRTGADRKRIDKWPPHKRFGERN